MGPRQKHKKLSAFTGLQTHDGVSKKSHATHRGRKKPKRSEPPRDKHKKTWYVKKINSEELATAEVIAQEFFRLMMPYQPKTRLGKDNQSNSYVLSQEAPEGYQDLVSLSAEELTSGLRGKYQGLGRILATSHFLQEIDLKFGNMGVDKQNRIIKIDGDWCFARLRNHAYDKGAITAKDIGRMPLVTDYLGWNWLDVQKEGKLATSAIFDNNFPNDVHFRKDLNYGMLQILLIPDSLRADFIESYTHNEELAELLFTEMSNRHQQLKSAALQNADFQQFLLSNDAKTCVSDYIHNLENFKTMGKNFLITDKEDFRKSTEEIFSGLKSTVTPTPVPSISLPFFTPPQTHQARKVPPPLPPTYSDIDYAETLFNDIQGENLNVNDPAEFSIYMCKFTRNLLGNELIDYSISFDETSEDYKVQSEGATIWSFSTEEFKKIVERAKERCRDTDVANLVTRRFKP